MDAAFVVKRGGRIQVVETIVHGCDGSGDAGVLRSQEGLIRLPLRVQYATRKVGLASGRERRRS